MTFEYRIIIFSDRHRHRRVLNIGFSIRLFPIKKILNIRKLKMYDVSISLVTAVTSII